MLSSGLISAQASIKLNKLTRLAPALPPVLVIGPAARRPESTDVVNRAVLRLCVDPSREIRRRRRRSATRSKGRTYFNRSDRDRRRAPCNGTIHRDRRRLSRDLDGQRALDIGDRDDPVVPGRRKAPVGNVRATTHSGDPRR